MKPEKILFQFPGQGSQYRGMGSDLISEFAIARDVYSRASDVLGYDLAKLSAEDPDGQLDLTQYTQPALLTHQIACLSVFASLVDGIEPFVAAGHSLGEYSALVAAGALSLEDGVALVAERGRLMSELGRGSMLATTLDLDTAKALADQYFCGIGGANLPEQTVIAGSDEDLKLLVEDLTANHPRKRAIELKTEGAFHTYLMVSAAEQFGQCWNAVSFKRSIIRFYRTTQANCIVTILVPFVPVCFSSCSTRSDGLSVCSGSSRRESTR
jgi:[acyl-carrier-protein] S-malonyltransferase